MKSIVRSITVILLTFAVLCAFAACENDKVNDNSDSQSSSTAAQTSSNNGDESTASKSSDESAESNSNAESASSENSTEESADNSTSEESSKADNENSTAKKLLYKLYDYRRTDDEARATYYEYTEFGEIATETLYEAVEALTPIITKYEYNEDRKLVSVMTFYDETETGKVTYEYNESGLLSKEILETDMGTRETIYTYTDNEYGGYTVKKSLSDGTDRGQEVYNKNGLLIEDKMEDGSKLIYTYNDKGNIISFESYDSTGKPTAKETYMYDGQTAVKKCYEQDKLVSTVKYYYDEDNDLIKITEIDESGKETLQEEREYKLFDIVK